MELKKIIDMLVNFKPQIVSSTEGSVYIQTHKMIKPGQSSFFPQCLYVGYVSELSPVIENNSISNLICIQDLPFPVEFRNCDYLNIILMDKNINQFDILNKIADIMIDEAKLIADMRCLLDALYENRGIQYMADVASEVFGNPIFINDIAYKILAMSQSTVFDDGTLENEKTLGYIHDENIFSMRRDHLFEKLGRLDYPLYSKKNKNGAGWLFRSIKIHGIDIGAVALVENNRPFREIDYELLERFSKLIAIEMEKSDFYKNNKGIMYNYFLADLIGSKIQTQKAIMQRLSHLHWKLYSNFQIVIIIDHEEEYFDKKADRIGEFLHQIIPDCRWTVYQKNLVIFLNRDSSNILTEKEKLTFENYLTQNKLSAGFSNPYSNIIETAKHYRQALRSVDLGVFINHKIGIYQYSDYMVSYIAQVLSKRHDLQDFCHPAIPVLQKYDEENNSELLETLNKYFYFVNNPVAASNALHIHRNTLLFRINKIKDLTQLDLSNGDERLLIQLYLKFLEYQKGNW